MKQTNKWEKFAPETLHTLEKISKNMNPLKEQFKYQNRINIFENYVTVIVDRLYTISVTAEGIKKVISAKK